MGWDCVSRDEPANMAAIKHAVLNLFSWPRHPPEEPPQEGWMSRFKRFPYRTVSSLLTGDKRKHQV
jgi:hypothetical protein